MSSAIDKSDRFFLFFRVELRSRLVLLLFIPTVWFLFKGDLLLLPRIDNLLVISDLLGIVIV